ncbi:MAG: DUF2236 domain-containing protein [Cyclobacteriaceae bacterium]|nr:DUF2236 domain-containing protein [Cyclobacteriaceae bacterium]
MAKEYFVDQDSIVRQIWGRSDTVLFIFAGAAAEFALNKSVDWLYFTGRLPADPIGRLFSTVSYARSIMFSEKETALRTIDAMTSIHAQVEINRGAKIPDWAYRDVLFMLIDYSIRAFEILERKLTDAEREEVFQVFNRLGIRMGMAGLPKTYHEWKRMRHQHLHANLQHSSFTTDLFSQYQKHLGAIRYWILREVQTAIVPQAVQQLLRLGKVSLLYPLLILYKLSRLVKLDDTIKSLLLPAKYKKAIRDLDYKPIIKQKDNLREVIIRRALQTS